MRKYSEQYKIAIVEDNETLQNGFSFLVSSHEKYTVCGSYGSVEQALKDLRRDMPDIILMDIGLPGMSGIEGIRVIKKILPSVHIIVLSVHEETDLVFEALCAGASGYITKNTTYDRIITAIEEVLKGGAPMSTQIARMVVSSFNKNPQSPLTSRETEVLELLASGKSYSRIAAELFVQKETIRSHLKHIYTKLQVNSKADAISEAKAKKYI